MLKHASMVNFPTLQKKTLPHFISYYLFVIIRYVLNYICMLYTFLTDTKKFLIPSSQNSNESLTPSYLQKHSEHITKLPKHIGFLINEDVGSKNYHDLSNLVVWASSIGIQYISLYDRHGILKSGEARLGKILRDKVDFLLGREYHLVIKNSSTPYENGTNYSNVVFVHLLSEEDGKPDILAAGKKIAADYCQKKINLEDITIEYVDKSLEAAGKIPDPNLLIQFGPVSSLLGFLPWQTRLTEILHVRTHTNLSCKQFYELLRMYSKCDQRFGK